MYENTFKEAFSGYRNSKDKFVEQLLLRYHNYEKTDLSKDELIKKAGVLYSSKPEKCDLINFAVNDIAREVRVIEEDTIWDKVVVGNQDVPISKLIEFLDNSDWVNQGQKYIQENEICPFCQNKTITGELQTQFKLFFSGEYEENINYIKSIVKKYQNLYTQLLEQLNILLFKENSISIGKLNAENFTTHRDLLKNIFDSNILEMSTKENEAGRKISLQLTDSNIDDLKIMIHNANIEITNHNRMVDNYNTEKTQLTKNVWSFVLTENETMISSYLDTLDSFDKAIKGISTVVENKKIELEQLNEKIVEDGKNITSIQPTVDEINRSLTAYGFTNFKIVASQEQASAYQICRDNGTPATNTLSEGEETFITFLYFMQLAKGATEISDIAKKRVLILDDPICSLDSTVLYIVSSIVKNLLHKIRNGESDVTQAFILTHNVFFHKEASFIDNRTKAINNVHYWIINKDNNISRIKAYGVNNPIKTSYELLWNELKTNTDYSKINTQNTMRRIIENYFSMIGKSINDELIKSFNTMEEQMICRALISWINDGSHSINDDLYIDSYTDSVERYKEIFKAIFVNMGHEAHYNMMMA